MVSSGGKWRVWLCSRPCVGGESHLPTALVDAGADADSVANLGGEPAVASIDGGSSSTGGSIVGSEGPDEGPAVERLK